MAMAMRPRVVRRRAKKYCKGVMDQRTGPVSVSQAMAWDCGMLEITDVFLLGPVEGLKV